MFLATGAIGGRNRRVVFVDATGSGSDASSYTFNGVAFGTASTRRHIIVGFSAGQAGANLNPPNSVTIGGVSASLVVGNPAGVGTAWVQLWIAAVPTGTSGTITCTRPGTMTDGGIAVWAAYDLSSASAFDTGSGNGNPTGSINVDTPSGGIAVGFVRDTAAGTQTFTWSGLTEDVDFNYGDSACLSGASASKVAAATPRSISVTASSSNWSGVSASWS